MSKSFLSLQARALASPQAATPKNLNQRFLVSNYPAKNNLLDKVQVNAARLERQIKMKMRMKSANTGRKPPDSVQMEIQKKAEKHRKPTITGNLGIVLNDHENQQWEDQELNVHKPSLSLAEIARLSKGTLIKKVQRASHSSMYMNQGHKSMKEVHQAHRKIIAKPISTSKLGSIRRYSDAISDFSGRPAGVRMKEFKKVHDCTVLVKHDQSVSSALLERSGLRPKSVLSRTSPFLFPSQFESDKPGRMGSEIKKNLIISPKRTEQAQKVCPVQTLNRLFSSSKVYKNEFENCSDGIILPMSFLDPLSLSEKNTFL